MKTKERNSIWNIGSSMATQNLNSISFMRPVRRLDNRVSSMRSELYDLSQGMKRSLWGILMDQYPIHFIRPSWFIRKNSSLHSTRTLNEISHFTLFCDYVHQRQLSKLSRNEIFNVLPEQVIVLLLDDQQAVVLRERHVRSFKILD